MLILGFICVFFFYIFLYNEKYMMFRQLCASEVKMD